jgi:hypothetical protein
MRRRFSPASVLRDLQRSGSGLTQIRPIAQDSGVGNVPSPSIPPASISGQHYAETRNVIPFTFDDSIDPTHPLDCFFRMPAGVLKIYSAAVDVRAAAFRAYETGSSGGGGTPTSQAGVAHNHLEMTIFTPTSTDGGHFHNYNMPSSVTNTENGHTHLVDTSHGHGITYGIFESGAATGTLTLKVDDGLGFGVGVASGASIAADVKASLSVLAGDRQLRIETAGVGAQARVKVLLMLDVLLKVNID